MNLNGTDPKKPSKTILNGYPLTHYDQFKRRRETVHRITHQRATLRSQQYIGDQKFLHEDGMVKPKQNQPSRLKQSIRSLVMTIVVIAIFVMIMTAIAILPYLFIR